MHAKRRRAPREPDPECRQVHGRGDHVEDVARRVGRGARSRGHHDGDGEHIVGEDGVMVQRGVIELGGRVGVVGKCGGVGEAGLEEAHGEAVERLGGGIRSDAGGHAARAARARELLADGEDGVGELLDLGLSVEPLLGVSGECARELDALAGLLLEGPERVLGERGGGEVGGEAGGERGEVGGEGRERERLRCGGLLELPCVRGVRGKDGRVVGRVAPDGGEARGRRGGRGTCRGGGRRGREEEGECREEEEREQSRERRAARRGRPERAAAGHRGWGKWPEWERGGVWSGRWRSASRI